MMPQFDYLIYSHLYTSFLFFFFLTYFFYLQIALPSLMIWLKFKEKYLLKIITIFSVLEKINYLHNAHQNLLYLTLFMMDYIQNLISFFLKSYSITNSNLYVKKKEALGHHLTTARKNKKIKKNETTNHNKKKEFGLFFFYYFISMI